MTILLSLCLVCFCFSSSSNAENNDNAEIIELLRVIEGQKETYGLEIVDFSLIKIGNVISVYDFVNDEFVFSRDAYPLFYLDELVAVVYKLDDSRFQMTNGLAGVINSLNKKEIAIVYDAQGCHIYDGESFNLIVNSTENDGTKDVLRDGLDCSGISLTDLSEREMLGYTAQPQSRIQINWYCGVTYVTQNPYGQIYWAATTACISNYLTGSSYTAEGIAKDYYNSNVEAVFNQCIENFEELRILNEYIGDTIEYVGVGGVPSDNCILGNIRNKYPIYAVFRASVYSYHATTIYHYALSGAGYISIMDPQIGEVMMERGANGYSYVSSYSNKEYTLARAYCAVVD